MRLPCPTIRAFWSLWVRFPVLLCIFMLLPTAWGQIYERATTSLKAEVTRRTHLRKAPSSKSRSLGKLKRGAPIQILGRQGQWFRVMARGKMKMPKGWIFERNIRVLTPTSYPRPQSRAKNKKSKKIDLPSQTLKRRRTFSGSLSRGTFQRPRKPFQFIPSFGLAYGAKSTSNQLWGSIDLFYSTWRKTDLGGTVELGLGNGTIISMGPTFIHHLSWPRLGKIRPSLYGGLSFFYASGSGNSDILFGPRFGSSFRYPFGKAFDLVVRVGADVLLFGSDVVLIPVIGTLGLAFKF